MTKDTIKRIKYKVQTGKNICEIYLIKDRHPIYANNSNNLTIRKQVTQFIWGHTVSTNPSPEKINR